MRLIRLENMMNAVNPLAQTHDPESFFVTHGYYVAERLVEPSELRELKEDLVRLARGEYACEALESLPPEATDEEAMERILCIHQPHFVSDKVLDFTRHPGVAALLSRLVGAHLPPDHWDGSVKCMQSMFFAKPPGKPGQAWHQDELYIPTRDRSLCGAWIAVDDATRENGCLWVLPGSHRHGVLYPQKHHDKPTEFDHAPESYGFDDSDEVAVEVPAGSVVFFNGYLLHRSKRNQSSGYRRALVSHYMSAQSLLPWCLESDVPLGQLGTADNRAVHLVSGSDPYASRPTVKRPDTVYLRTFGVEK